jgi:hypothetical protein
MALALRFETLLSKGEVASYAELARLGHVSCARISQILNLLHLAPDLQEELLFLTRKGRGRDRIHLARLQPIAAQVDWAKQRRLWRDLLAASGAPVVEARFAAERSRWPVPRCDSPSGILPHQRNEAAACGPGGEFLWLQGFPRGNINRYIFNFREPLPCGHASFF